MDGSTLPTSEKVRGDKSSDAMMRLRQHVDNRLIGLRVDRFSWWIHWRELADYILPRRYKWLITPNQATRGSPINQRIIDSTGTLAMRTCASGMMSGMTSPGRPWFRMTLENKDLAEDPEVKTWLEQVRERMMTVFAESNFYQGMAVMYQDLAVFGTGPMLVYEDHRTVIRCYNPCAGEYYVSNSERLQIEVFYREFVLTTDQVAREFGLENCSPTVTEAIRTAGAMLTREIRIGHAIEPNDEFVPDAPGMAGMPYREIYWELGSGQNYTLRIKGYHEFPCVCPRWDIVGNDAYGRSPGMDALGDIKQLQSEQKRKGQAIDKHVNPPLVADVALKNEPASLLPGGVTYVPSTAGAVGFKPVYQVQPDMQGMLLDIKEVQERIRTTFFSDLFLMISQIDTVRSATEIDARKEEKLIQLGPVIERFQNEALDPIIDRTFSIMLRNKKLPPLPQALMRGAKIKVEYVSMLAEAQKAVFTAAIERLFQFAGNMAGAIPTILDNLDGDVAIEKYADYLGVTPEVIVSLKKVAALRQTRAQQQQQAQLMQQTMAGAQGAKVLSEAQVGGGANALQKMLGN